MKKKEDNFKQRRGCAAIVTGNSNFQILSETIMNRLLQRSLQMGTYRIVGKGHTNSILTEMRIDVCFQA